ncbi:MAG: SlyX family protein [Pirellulales bacterium]
MTAEPNNPQALPGLAERITNLEMLFTHLERTLADLNTVLLEHGRRLDDLHAQLERAQSQPEPSADDDALE